MKTQQDIGDQDDGDGDTEPQQFEQSHYIVLTAEDILQKGSEVAELLFDHSFLYSI